MEKTKLLNTYVNNVTLKEAVEFLLQKAVWPASENEGIRL